MYLSLTNTVFYYAVKGNAGFPSTKVTLSGNPVVVARYIELALARNFRQASWSIQELTAGN